MIQDSNEMFAPDWFKMNLSELVETSLHLGVVPIFNFIDKDKVGISETPKKPTLERTPIDVLEYEIKFFERMITKIENKDGIEIPNEEAAKKITQVKNDLKKKIREFKKAIKTLNQLSQ